ncbi:MAG: nitrophenyl compound nitroreductase subunit ArsF family protein [Chitinispirillaceae bacterium]|jgi:hypothetical protein|nr:nitrophenyl compound nitroreductase subunit ArsF family protein [Chitinispirillaceae bacterium]
MKTGLVSKYSAVLAMVVVSLVFCQSVESAKKKTEPKVAASVKEQSSDTVKQTPAAPTADKLVVYYLHGTFRCPSCNKIEALTKQAVETGFAEQIKSGRLELKVLNVEDKGNEHFVDDYKLYTKSVILSELVNNKEKSWKNLDKVWTLLHDDGKFIAYIQKEIADLIKG